MNSLEELKEVQELIKQVKESLLDAPEGRLRCEMAQGKYPQYYLISEKEKEQFPRGRFLRKEERGLAKLIAQKEYDLKMLELLKRRERLLKQWLKKETKAKEVYEKLPETRKLLVMPYVISDEQFVKEWQQDGLAGQNPFPFENGFVTERGEIVRSKSEKMIADKLYYMNIPYKYEAALKLGNSGTVYPDFTLLNVEKRETLYLEHFGMMDSPEYCKKALDKLERYEKNHIYPGEKLLVTFESSLKGIDMKQVESMLRRYLK